MKKLIFFVVILLCIGWLISCPTNKKSASSSSEDTIVNEGDEAELSVYTFDGKLAHRQVVANGRQSINVILPQGVYMVRISAGENVAIERIVVQ